ncbi:MAG: hypothetical protein ACI4PV_04330, partial [Butyricicoccus sp.]
MDCFADALPQACVWKGTCPKQERICHGQRRDNEKQNDSPVDCFADALPQACVWKGTCPKQERIC